MLPVGNYREGVAEQALEKTRQPIQAPSIPGRETRRIAPR